MYNQEVSSAVRPPPRAYVDAVFDVYLIYESLVDTIRVKCDNLLITEKFISCSR